MTAQLEPSSIINIAVIGGGDYCRELLEKTTVDYREREVNARMAAVADPDPRSPGMRIARKLGLITVNDYHELYDSRYGINLFIILRPEQEVLEDILQTKPSHIRVQSYHVFEVFWKAISIEENKLRKRNEEIETILNGIQDFIVVLSPELEIVQANEAFFKKMGYSDTEIIGKKCHEVFQKIDHQCNHGDIVCPLNEVIRQKRPLQQIRKREKKNGEMRYTEVTTFPIWGEDGRISKFVEISRDITKRKKEEEEITRQLEGMVEERTRQLRETHEKLLHKDKMASLGKLSASVVHEINNPIAGILNLILLMKRMIQEDSMDEKEILQFRDFLNLMEAENKRISRIVSDLLSFSRESKMEPKPLNLNLLIEKTLLLNANLLKIHRVKVEKRLFKNLPEIIGSEDQLQQVFVNMISNAVEAMEPTGEGVLTIETKYLKKIGKISVIFRDTGSGIPEQNIPLLFEPFYTTKKRGKGVGLGLSVAYGIIQDHGGSIWVSSKEGEGTTFKVEFKVNGLLKKCDQDGGRHGQR